MMMKHKVLIDVSPELWKAGNFDSDTLTPAIPTWLREQGITDWNWEHEYIYAAGTHKLVFRFRHETDAVAFKMRWA